MDKLDDIILALPKGRIAKELKAVLDKCGIIPEADFYNADSRALRFRTNHENLQVIRARSFDVATFVAFGAAHLGVVGSDVLSEFDYSDIYSPLDLRIGKCRLSVAEPTEILRNDDPSVWSHVRVATKYPQLTQRHFAARGVQAECIKLSGAIELAANLGLCRCIVDLVSTGKTLKANGLSEVEKIMDISSRLIINKAAQKTLPKPIAHWHNKFKEACHE